MNEVKNFRFQPIGNVTKADFDGVIDQVQAVRLADDKTGVVIADSDGNSLGIVLPVKDDAKPSETIDTLSVNDNAARDAAAIVASLRKNDTTAADLLLGFYENDAKAQAALCGSLAAFACACLATIDNVRDHVLVSDGVMLPSGDEVLKTVMMKLAEPEK